MKTQKIKRMKTKHILISAASVSIIAALTITACKKKDKNEEQPDTSYSYVNDHNLAETHNNDVGNIGSEAGETGSVNNYRLENGNAVYGIESAPCATVTLDLAAKQFTVDFGSTLCLCKDGRYRSGKLIYNYSASTNGAVWPRQPGYSITCTSQNYLVSNSSSPADAYTVNIINRTHTNTTPLGFNPSTTNLTWTVSANIQVIKPASAGGGTISWNSNRTIELMNTNDPTVYDPSGNVPIAWNKAKLKINGSTNGTTANGVSYSSTLSNLIWDAQCTPDPLKPFRHPFTSGTITFTPSGKPARVIDFGYGGGCDFLAQVCIPTYNFCANITLP